jgi:hypothetical protein
MQNFGTLDCTHGRLRQIFDVFHFLKKISKFYRRVSINFKIYKIWVHSFIWQLTKHVHAKFQLSSFCLDGLRQILTIFQENFRNQVPHLRRLRYRRYKVNPMTGPQCSKLVFLGIWKVLKREIISIIFFLLATSGIWGKYWFRVGKSFFCRRISLFPSVTRRCKTKLVSRLKPPPKKLKNWDFGSCSILGQIDTETQNFFFFLSSCHTNFWFLTHFHAYKILHASI